MVLSNDHIKKIITAYFKNKPVNKVWLFGSYANGEATADSDVDVLIDIDYGQNVGWDYFIWHEELSQILDNKVDVVSVAGLSKYILAEVEKTKHLVYEKAGR